MNSLCRWQDGHTLINSILDKRCEKDLPTRIFCCSLELNMDPYNVKIMRQKRSIENDVRA